MVEWLLQPEVLVYVAGGSFVLAYLIINQVILRLIVTFGTATYIMYYATVGETPLWGAIYASLAMGAANLIGLAALLARRSRLIIPAEHRDLYPRFAHLPPGDFRALMRYGRRYVTPNEEVLGVEGAPVDHLAYIISGRAQVTKRDVFFELPPGVFVGEVAYMLGRNSAATTVLPEGAELVRWDTGVLTRVGRRNPRFKLALEAAISRDMAAKVALAVAPGDLQKDAKRTFDMGPPSQ